MIENDYHEPQMKQGHWEDRDFMVFGQFKVASALCSECKLYSYQVVSTGYLSYEYCPHCGANMQETF